ncbi:methyl-accepting chemotaxis protein [Colwelliaceae bacterium 6441]
MSISRKLLIYLLGSISVLLLLSSFIIVKSLASDSRKVVRNDVMNIVTLEGNKIKSFFEEKGRRLETLFRNPQIAKWFDRYQDKDTDVSQDEEFDNIINTFKAESQSEKSIKSIFFAHHKTGVYFFEQGTHWKDDYNLTTRSWYVDALEKGGLNIGKMDVDSIDEAIYTAIYSTLKNTNGQVLGLAGMDISLVTIADIVSNISYRGQGRAILVNKSSEVMYMPSIEGQEPLPLNAKLEVLDGHPGNSGFSALSQKFSEDSIGHSEVIWNDIRQEVAFIEIKSNQPSFNWLLILMVPQELVEEKVNQSITSSIVFILIILGAITFVVLIVTRAIVKPLTTIEKAMYDIAHGEGDLTKRIEIKTNDEVGRVATEFNRFVERIQQLISQVSQSSGSLQNTINDFSQLTLETSERSSQSSEVTQVAASTVTSVSQAAKNIFDTAKIASQSAQEANQSASKGREDVEKSVQSITDMEQSIDHAVQVIANLRENSESIGEVLNVIRSIAEQTNLLALNAAIEAARAGEQGRGFAVVADEVRTLASRTQESTNNIQQMIESLQSSSKEAGEVMSSNQQQMKLSVAQINTISETFNDILQKVTSVQEQNNNITESTEQQNLAAVEMENVIDTFKDIAEKGLVSADEMRDRCDSLNVNAEQLNEEVGKFKI